ncbi:hypothetical protein F5Y04DRAFT_175617 [Hypomontagnella monticulosa]|nr:hypothetical protein F5Y04DRAFT_175617 [Hypomontagnella monticulosa]
MAPFESNNVTPDDRALVRDLLVPQRVGMGSWEWEITIISSDELAHILLWPCYGGSDHSLVRITADWIRLLYGLCHREWRSPTRQVAHQGYLSFASLLTLVSRLNGLIHLYNLGDPATVRTPAHHRTFWPHTPRSDVAQARSTIATLVSNGFGSWLDGVLTGNWQQPMRGYYDFAFGVGTGILGWANAREGSGLLPRIELHLIFPGLDPLNQGQHTTQEVPAEEAPAYQAPVASYAPIAGPSTTQTSTTQTSTLQEPTPEESASQAQSPQASVSQMSTPQVPSKIQEHLENNTDEIGQSRDWVLDWLDDVHESEGVPENGPVEGEWEEECAPPDRSAPLDGDSYAATLARRREANDDEESEDGDEDGSYHEAVLDMVDVLADIRDIIGGMLE